MQAAAMGGMDLNAVREFSWEVVMHGLEAVSTRIRLEIQVYMMNNALFHPDFYSRRRLCLEKHM
jgi:hypothetical protein